MARPGPVTISEERGGVTLSTPAMHIGPHAVSTPEKPAAILSTTGETMTFTELDARSRALAGVLAGRHDQSKKFSYDSKDQE
jgi:hypothetical protein